MNYDIKYQVDMKMYWIRFTMIDNDYVQSRGDSF